MDGKKRSSVRVEADLLSAYGGSPADYFPAGLTHEIRIGLYLNINRIRWQRAHEVRRGIELALSKDELPREYFEAVSANDKEANFKEAHENLKRMKDKLRAESAKTSSFSPHGYGLV